MPKDELISTQAAIQASRAERMLAEPKFLQLRKDMRAGNLVKLQMQLVNGFGRTSLWFPLGDEAQGPARGHVATQSNLYLAPKLERNSRSTMGMITGSVAKTSSGSSTACRGPSRDVT